jgi:ABC-type nitrate/sulfonate/bicarbonate transport system permease component
LIIGTAFGHAQESRSIDRTTLKVAQAARASEWLIFRDIILPAALPSVLTGLGSPSAARG